MGQAGTRHSDEIGLRYDIFQIWIICSNRQLRVAQLEKDHSLTEDSLMEDLNIILCDCVLQ